MKSGFIGFAIGVHAAHKSNKQPGFGFISAIFFMLYAAYRLPGGRANNAVTTGLGLTLGFLTTKVVTSQIEQVWSAPSSP